MSAADFLLTVLILVIILVLVYVFVLNTGVYTYKPENNEDNTNLTNSSFSSLNYSVNRLVINTSYPLLFQNIRWDHMPISIYLDSESGRNTNLFGEDDLDDFRSAMKIWEQKTDGTISFVETDNRNGADVMVQWVGSLNATMGAKTVGEGGPTVIDTGLFNLTVSGEIFLIPTDVSCKNVNRDLHELGHVLGLDHTGDRNDIMYPYESCSLEITEGAIGTLKDLYKAEPKPDLYFLNASAKKIGNYLSLEIVIKNWGILKSANTSVALMADNSTLETYPFMGLSPGEAYVLRITNKITSKFNSLKLIIDPNNLVDELDKSNNVIVLTPS